jgi:hypothetical protein
MVLFEQAFARVPRLALSVLLHLVLLVLLLVLMKSAS